MNNFKGRAFSIFFDLVLGAVGFVLLLNPQSVIDFVRFFLGSVLIITSIIPFYKFFKPELEKQWSDFFKGGILALVGLFLIFSPSFSNLVLAIALIIWMASSGITKIMAAIEYKKMFETTWWYMLVFGIIALAFSVFVIFNMNTVLVLIRIAGVFMIVESVLGVIETLLYRNTDVIDV